MKLLSIGLKYTSAPLGVREKLAFSSPETISFLSSLPEEVVEAALLSTCNRTELYTVAEGQDHYQLINWLTSFKGLSRSKLLPYFYSYESREVVRHLFRVTAGLDSMVFGEEQIQGQVKVALQLSLQAKAAKRLLSFILRQALRVGRRLRRETELSKIHVSVGSLALEIAKKRLGVLNDCSLLIIGTGKIAQFVGKAAQANHIGQLLVVSRTLSRAQALAEKLGGQAIPIGKLAWTLSSADIVISATSSPHFVVTDKLIREAMISRNHRPLLLLDLGVPRNIEPEVKEIKGVQLYDLDDLNKEINGGDEDRRGIIRQAEDIIDEEIGQFLRFWCLQEVVPVIKALRERAEGIRLRELKKTLKKLDLPEEERGYLDILTRSLINKLLHHPTIWLKKNSQQAGLIKEIFNL